MDCPFALQLPGPDWKRGYNYGTLHLTHEKTGVTIHTAEYDLAEDDKILYNALFSDRIASWHFTITKEGWLFQHYPVDTTCWHAGYDANLWTVGIECEGIAPDKISGSQYGLLVRLLRWIKEDRNWGTGYWRDIHASKEFCCGLWEHRDWMATDCAVFSRGMIDAGKLIADLKEEEVIDWPKEKLRLLNEFIGWWTFFPETQKEKDELRRQNAEDAGYRQFYETQIAWRSPPR